MKYKASPVAAIFFMTSFNRNRGGGGGVGTLPWSRSCDRLICFTLFPMFHLVSLSIFFVA